MTWVLLEAWVGFVEEGVLRVVSAIPFGGSATANLVRRGARFALEKPAR